MKKLSFLLITLLILASCNNEETPNDPITSDQAIASIEDAAGQMSQDIIDLVESDGLYSIEASADFIFEFMDLGQGNARTTKQRLLDIVKFFATDPASRTDVEEPEMPTGLYEWDAVNEEFVKDDTYEGDDLVLLFPVGESTTNNGRFTLSSFELNADDLPTLVEMDLKVDDVQMVDLYLAVNWSSFGFPEDGELYLFVNPFSLNVGYNLTDGTGTTVSVTLENGDDLIASIGLETSSSLESIFESEELPSVSGHVQYRGIKLEGSVDLAGMDDAFENDQDPNEHFDLALYIDDEKAGDIVLVLETVEGYTDYYPYIEFNDGTMMSLEDFFEEIGEEMEEAFNDFTL